MTRYQVVHATRYRYAEPVTSSYGQAALLPRSTLTQTCRSSSLTIEPEASDQRERVDVHGNRVVYFSIDRPHRSLAITARSEVDVRAPKRPSSGPSLAEAVAAVDELEGADRVEAVSFLLDSPRLGPHRLAGEFAAELRDPALDVVEALAQLGSAIHERFSFDAGATTVTSTLDDLFRHSAGVCQDFAHLTVAVLRTWGLPARYVSGYLETDPPPGQPKLQGADVSHAWASALVPGLGWIDLDPTNDQFANDRYVTVGWGRDYGDVPPLTGVIYTSGGTSSLEVSVDVRRVAERDAATARR